MEKNENEKDLGNRLQQFLHRYNDNQDRKKPGSPEIDENVINTIIIDIECDLNTPPKRKSKELSSKSEKLEEKTKKNFEKIEEIEEKPKKNFEEIEEKPNNEQKNCEYLKKIEKKDFFENFMKKNLIIEKKTKEKIYHKKTGNFSSFFIGFSLKKNPKNQIKNPWIKPQKTPKKKKRFS